MSINQIINIQFWDLMNLKLVMLDKFIIENLSKQLSIN